MMHAELQIHAFIGLYHYSALLLVASIVYRKVNHKERIV